MFQFRVAIKMVLVFIIHQHINKLVVKIVYVLYKVKVIIIVVYIVEDVLVANKSSFSLEHKISADTIDNSKSLINI